jgi:hypothetical protein
VKDVPTLFVRDPQTGRVTDEVTPGCEWIASAPHTAHRRFDGLWTLVVNGVLYKSSKRDKSVATVWTPTNKSDVWHVFAAAGKSYLNGLYFLVGPKVGRNYDRFRFHTLVLATEGTLGSIVPRTSRGLRYYLMTHPHMYGVFWMNHRSIDGESEFAQVTRKDFGLPASNGQMLHAIKAMEG